MFWKLYLIALPVFLIIDGLWLGLVARKFYSQQIGLLMKAQPNWLVAGLFYLLFIVGLVVFVLQPALAKGSWTYAILYGALFGLISYATYDLTNLATLQSWPLLVTVVDLIWGAILSASVCGISYWIAGKV